MTSLREELCQLINDDTCKSCEFWDKKGYYCFILTIHKDTKKCLLMDKIFALLSQHGVVQLDESQELPKFDRWGNEYTPDEAYNAALDNMLKANFKRVCPLVGIKS